MKKYSTKDLREIEKKIDLSLKFGQTILGNPVVLERIPEGAHVALMPDNDFSLAQENFELTSKMAKKSKAHVLAFVGHKIHKEKPKVQLNYQKTQETCWT